MDWLNEPTIQECRFEHPHAVGHCCPVCGRRLIDLEEFKTDPCEHVRLIHNGAVSENIYESKQPAKNPIRFVIFRNPYAALMMVIDMEGCVENPGARYWATNAKWADGSLRWLDDDLDGRRVLDLESSEDYEDPAQTIKSMKLPCDSGELRGILDKHLPVVRLNGEIRIKDIDGPCFTLTWIPGAPEAEIGFSDGETGESGEVSVGIKSGDDLKAILKDHMISEVEGAVGMDDEDGNPIAWSDIEFTIGKETFKIEEAADPKNSAEAEEG